MGPGAFQRKSLLSLGSVEHVLGSLQGPRGHLRGSYCSRHFLNNCTPGIAPRSVTTPHLAFLVQCVAHHRLLTGNAEHTLPTMLGTQVNQDKGSEDTIP